MISRISFPASGCLFGVRSKELREGWYSQDPFRNESAGRRGWLNLILKSKGPLLKEPGLPEEGDYEYPFLLRVSGNHFLALGLHASLVDVLFELAGLRFEVY